MANIRVETTQNVDIQYEVASIGDRILATLLDYLFFFAYSVLILIILALENGYGENTWVVLTVCSLPILLYDLCCEVFFQGKSFGKMIMNIKVVKVDGTQANFGAYLIRWLLRIIDMRLFSGVVALVAVLINGKGQRIGDMAAGTTVIKLKQKVHLRDTILNKIAPDYTLVFPQVSRLSDSDIAIIKDVMKVCLRTNNYEAVEKLALKTKETMGVTVNMPHVQFLATVVQDYTYYGSQNQ